MNKCIKKKKGKKATDCARQIDDTCIKNVFYLALIRAFHSSFFFLFFIKKWIIAVNMIRFLNIYQIFSFFYIVQFLFSCHQGYKGGLVFAKKKKLIWIVYRFRSSKKYVPLVHRSRITEAKWSHVPWVPSWARRLKR